jgi:molybdate/tungstate transport system substrate-binding protein
MKRIPPFPKPGVCLPAFLALSLLLACADPPPGRAVSVLYAGSLATVMENGVGPAFSKATGYRYKGEAHGSLGAARLIHDHLRTPDVFLSADPAVNESVLMGAGNGGLVTWYVTLASSQLVLAYNPKSPQAAGFEAAAAGKVPTIVINKGTARSVPNA